MSIRHAVLGISVLAGAANLAAAPPAAPDYKFSQAQTMLKTYCLGCHQGAKPSGGFDVAKLIAEQTLFDEPRNWTRMVHRVRESEMPPKGAPAPASKDRESFVAFIDYSLRTAACADGISPRPGPIRRLNRNEFSATVSDLLNIHVNAGHALPADGAGGEGFDNAAETLFLSPIHAEKYLEAAKQALGYAFSDTKSRSRFLIAEPNGTTTPAQAAKTVLEKFMVRAFRRPLLPGELEKYQGLFAKAQQRGDNYEQAISYALQGVLISPHFLFRYEEPNPGEEPRLVNDYAMATRLSYFLWGSMPDDALFDLAAAGKLSDPTVLNEQMARMLKDPKSRAFAENFVEQWLNTRELGRDIKPDPKLFPAYYDEEIASGMRYEPILFFQELLAQDLSLLNIIDSNFTILSNKLQKHYGIELQQKLRQQPVRVELPPGTHRGGILGMAAILAVSSYPNRTSPVLRGKWVLEALLGTPPPPPPPNVPQLAEAHDGAAPKTLRERLEAHRANPVCASCHSKIDPLGFGLENYDVLGRWRTEDAGKPIDSQGELPDGSRFNGPQEMKAILMKQKDLLIRNLTSKMLGYALGRGLNLEDYCTVDRIVETLGKDDYKAQTLIREVILSVPFRYQPGTVSNKPVLTSANQQK